MGASVLFVCLGNICRSPTAEGVFRSILAQNPQVQLNQWTIDSAGTGAWHVGNPPDSRAQSAASHRGYDLSAIKARQVVDSDFDDFDYILAMDKDNLAHLTAMANQRRYGGHLGLFLDFAHSSIKEVPDPYYGGSQGFETVLDLIEEASTGLITHIQQQIKS